MTDTYEYRPRFRKDEQKPEQTTSLFGEAKLLIIIFVCVFVGTLVFTNAPLFVQSLFDETKTIWVPPSSVNNDIATTIEQNQAKQAEIQSLIVQYKSSNPIANPVATSIQTTLENKINDYDFAFNTLPPTNRVMIPKLGLDVPLIHLTHKAAGDFVAGDFDTELQQGVVKYPTTPAPGESGNTLIFGHTSTERWKHNSYGTVFAKLPKLQAGDTIQVVREWELYTYSVQEIVVHEPKEVDNEFQKRQDADGEYITLMGCYPIGTSKERMMVIAKRI